MRTYLLLGCVLLAAACGSDVAPGRARDLSIPGGGDGGGPGPVDMKGSGPCDDQTNPCPMGRRCYDKVCIDDNGTCQSDNDCQNDTYCNCKSGGGDMGACVGGVCIPWGTPPRGLFDPACTTPTFSATDFKPPVLHCKWTGSSGSNFVTMTPLVIDLDGDGKPEILFGPMGSNYQQRLVALRSSDCTVLFDKPINAQGYSQYAAGDLDGDKRPEIVALGNDKRVRVYDNQGNLVATSPTAYSFSAGGGFDCSGPAIANIDGMGPPEIAVAGQVLRYTKGNNTLQVLWTKPVLAAYWGTLDSVADLDGDGTAEVIVGKQIFDGVTGADKTKPGLKALMGTIGAYPAIADFNKDGKPDVVAVQSTSGNQSAFVYDYANDKVIFGPYNVGSGGWGGPPTVADFDGDGVPDFGLASSTKYYVYALKCANQVKPPDCKGADPGTLWTKNTRDSSSGGTGSSVFDFNGDGKAEVVYRDECWLRVYNGPDGKTVFAATVTSGTAIEVPVIADIDNDGHADIVVSADNIQAGFSSCTTNAEAETGAPWTGYSTGLFVYRDPMNRWMPSRGIWNQSTYHITNIEDDTSIPMSESPNWSKWNNYRQNVQGAIPGMPMPQGDFTGGKSGSIDNGGNDCKTSERLWAMLCNRGTAVVPPGVSGAFYSTDPKQPNPMLICTTKTTKQLQPGDCEPVYCDWMNPPQGSKDIWFRANDDGTGKMGVTQCKTGNDILYMPGKTCFIPG